MKRVGFLLLMTAATFLCGSPAEAKQWAEWRGGDLKYAMLLATDMRIVDKDFGDGWFGINAITDSGETIFLFSRSSPRFEQQITKAYIEDFTGVPLGSPKKVEPSKGWTWRERYEVRDNKRVLWVDMGQGPSGTYAFVLSTNDQDLQSRQSEYSKWRDSLELW